MNRHNFCFVSKEQEIWSESTVLAVGEKQIREKSASQTLIFLNKFLLQNARGRIREKIFWRQRGSQAFIIYFLKQVRNEIQVSSDLIRVKNEPFSAEWRR